ncbi:major capsid protein [Endozoicomonas elysicola]|uniref:Methyltransferase n=1 Tax=Endozoicomonas elysicola TaxID=305900 RepID=A0A081K835_9GAMM|nr:major capsid protein [Endozoicomonas elysicola]KEI70311.1 hypothetical protein GV64_05795 [Endozoicomonas elysicola]
MKKLKHLGLLVASALMSSSVFAAIDISAATTALTTDGSAAITAVGTALVGLAGIAVVFKWVKGAIFG